MSNALDMSLEDIIKSNKKDFVPRGRGAFSGPTRRFSNRSANRVAPYAAPMAVAKAPETAWQHDMFVDDGLEMTQAPVQAERPSSIETGTKLYISNLDYGVSNDDIKELFTEVGDLKRYAIHYDRSGRSKGTAEVVFTRRLDAVAAVKRYNNVQLDGKPMKIEIIGTNIATPTAPPPATNGALGNMNTVNPSAFPGGRGARGGTFGMFRGRGGRWPGRGRGRGRGRGERLSVEDLDADLDKYHSEAMQIN